MSNCSHVCDRDMVCFQDNCYANIHDPLCVLLLHHIATEEKAQETKIVWH